MFFDSRSCKSRAASVDQAIPGWDNNRFNKVLDQLKSGRIRRVVALCGAGLSTPSGISDFRSPRTGLYDNLTTYNVPYPEALFELSYLRQNPRAFFQYYKTLVLTLAETEFRPNLGHYFLALLCNKKALLRVYTQNVDGLELKAGLTNDTLVQSHGHTETAKCIKCSKLHSKTYIEMHVRNNTIPFCNSATCSRGIVKPQIVFFGEDLPPKFYMHRKDLQLADLVIIMGTSLTVEPFNQTLRAIKHDCPVILMNNNLVGAFRRFPHPEKFFLKGNLVETVQKVANIVGWDQDLYSLQDRTQLSLTKVKNATNIRQSNSYYDKWSRQSNGIEHRSSRAKSYDYESSSSSSSTPSLSSVSTMPSEDKKTKKPPQRRVSFCPVSSSSVRFYSPYKQVVTPIAKPPKSNKKTTKKKRKTSKKRPSRSVEKKRKFESDGVPKKVPEATPLSKKLSKIIDDSAEKVVEHVSRLRVTSWDREIGESRIKGDRFEDKRVVSSRPLFFGSSPYGNQRRNSLQRLDAELWKGRPIQDEIEIDGNLKSLLDDLDSIPLPVF